MAVLAGSWSEPIISGDRTISVGGVDFQVPENAVVKKVKAGRGLEIVHVKVDGRVHVLAANGQLIESDAEAVSRAHEHPWNSIRGEII